MGVVYRAYDTKLDRDVALKFLPQNFVSSEQEITRFEQEARAISALNHPSIETIHDVDEFNGQKYLVLEYIPGGTLKTKLKKLKSEGSEFSINEVINYGIEIAEGLAHAHGHGIIHRDVKTDNIMLTAEGKIKLTDFGLAKHRGINEITKTGTTVGTLAYMSPEQIRGEDLDQGSDIFSLGTVLYELVTSCLPFRGEFEAALAYSILNEKPGDINSLRKDISPPLAQVISHCLEKNRSDRYQSAREIADALRSIQRGTYVAIKIHARKPKILWTVTAAILLLAAAGIYLFYTKPGVVSTNSKTIAVLPFLNLSGQAENEYFSDGITEDILTQISKIADLYVISRTTIMQYKGTKKIMKEIGKELSAGVILEGSVRQSGNRIRVTSQLIDAETDKHIWAETYDRELKDVFAIQTDVAEKIAAALKAKLSSEERALIEKKPTDNTVAYDYYLEGREYYYHYTNEDNDAAIERFKKAIDLDPKYALAWAGLSDAYSIKYSEFHLSNNWLDSAVEAGTKAVAFDGNSAEAYKALGLAYDCMELYTKGLEYYQKAVQLNPNFLPAISNMGAIYFTMGDVDKAFIWFKKAIRLSPTYVVQYTNMSILYRLLGEYDKADEWVRKSLNIQPDYISGNSALIYNYLLQGKNREVKEVMQKLISSNPNDHAILELAGFVAGATGDFKAAKKYYEQSIAMNPSFKTDPTTTSGIGLANMLLKEGKRAEAEKLLNGALVLLGEPDSSKMTGGDPEYTIAEIHAIKGDKKEACNWFQKSVNDGYREYRLALLDPCLENIRNEEQFKKTIEQLKSKVEEMRKAVEAMEKDSPE